MGEYRETVWARIVSALAGRRHTVQGPGGVVQTELPLPPAIADEDPLRSSMPLPPGSPTLRRVSTRCVALPLRMQLARSLLKDVMPQAIGSRNAGKMGWIRADALMRTEQGALVVDPTVDIDKERSHPDMLRVEIRLGGSVAIEVPPGFQPELAGDYPRFGYLSVSRVTVNPRGLPEVPSIVASMDADELGTSAHRTMMTLVVPPELQ